MIVLKNISLIIPKYILCVNAQYLSKTDKNNSNVFLGSFEKLRFRHFNDIIRM